MREKLIDADWLKGREACFCSCPGHSVVVRDSDNPANDRRIPCESKEEAETLFAALGQFARPGVTVVCAYDPI
jgi:hypothetical protein